MPSTADVMAWVDGYERAWRAGDEAGVARLFTEDARYRHSPYEPDIVGHAAIRAEWDDPRQFAMTAQPVAVQGDRAVIRVTVRYVDPASEYGDLWILTFAPDGRVADFEEWAYWPGRAYSKS